MEARDEGHLDGLDVIENVAEVLIEVPLVSVKSDKHVLAMMLHPPKVNAKDDDEVPVDRDAFAEYKNKETDIDDVADVDVVADRF